MSSYINRKFDLEAGESVIISMERWGDPHYSIQLASGSVTVEDTLDQVNRDADDHMVPGSVTWSPATDTSGTALGTLAPADGVTRIEYKSVEAFRVTAVTAAVGRLLQTGE